MEVAVQTQDVGMSARPAQHIQCVCVHAHECVHDKCVCTRDKCAYMSVTSMFM